MFLTEKFLDGNVPLGYLLNEEFWFMSWQGSHNKGVNDWVLKIATTKKFCKNFVKCSTPVSTKNAKENILK